MFPDPPGATDDPPLPKLIPGQRYLDSPIGTTVEELKERIRPLDIEVAGVSADGRLIDFAPLVGGQDQVEFPGIANKLRNMHLIHNHPGSSVLSYPDVRFAIRCDLKSITAVLRDGGELRLERKDMSWPAEDVVRKAYDLGRRRGVEAGVGKSRRKRLEIEVGEINKALFRALGAESIQIDLQ